LRGGTTNSAGAEGGYAPDKMAGIMPALRGNGLGYGVDGESRLAFDAACLHQV